ncbi:MAG: hypothetical protein K2H39_05975, partial [Paramuribaculum sp.]|nr:hypothetical protein [Paramuribaculum sp.]
SPNSEVKQALASMNKSIANRKNALKKRELREDSIRATLDSLTGYEKLKAAQRLAFNFTAVNVDSAIKYYSYAENLAEELNDESKRLQLEAHRLSMATFLGDMYKTSELFEKIDTTKMNKDDLREYFAAGSRLYLAYASYVTPEQAGISLEKGKRCAKRYLELSEKDTPEYNYVEAVIADIDGRHARAIALAGDALENQQPQSIYHTWCEEILGATYLHDNKKEEAIIHFANAVKNDAEQGFQIGNGARLLANLMIHEGEFSQADKLLQFALINAINSGDKMRFSQAVSLSPEITNRYRGTNSVARVIIISLVALMIIGLAFIARLIVKLRRKKRHIDVLTKKNAEARIEKTTYIREFLNMSAIYLEKMDEYKTSVQKKIKSGKLEEVISALRSGEMFQSQSDTFYSLFDRAFIHAFPDFVKEVNNLMQPDKILVQPQPEFLTTDLRLLAFMRLGIDDSTVISRFMGLSINTIYSYRNRLRSRAINRETFEKDITKVG